MAQHPNSLTELLKNLQTQGGFNAPDPVAPTSAPLAAPTVGPTIANAAPSAGAVALDPNQGATFDFSGLPNISDTGLSTEAFGRLSPTAQGAIIPEPAPRNFPDVPLATPSDFTAPTQTPNAPLGIEATQARLGEIFGEAPQTLSQVTANDPASIAARDASESFNLAGIAAGTRPDAQGNFAEPSRGVARGPDSTDRAPGELTMESATRLAKGDRQEAERMIELQGMGRDPFTAQLPKPEEAAAPEKQTALDDKVQTIMEASGVSLSEATGLATGTTRLIQNPITGATNIVDMTTGEARPITGINQRTIPDFNVSVPEEGQSLFDRAAGATGAVEAGKRALQQVTGQAGIDVATDESIQTQQDFATAQNNLVRAFREGGRFSAAETKLLREELDISLSALKDPKTLENKLKSIDRSLERRFENSKSEFLDPNTPAPDIKDALSKMRAIAEFRAELGVPQEDASSGGTAPEGTPDDIAEVYSFLTDEDKTRLGVK